MGKSIRSKSDDIALQSDLARMKEWQMQFDISKYKNLSVERGNSHNRYTINNEPLVGSKYEKDLGIIVGIDLGLRKQSTDASK